MKHVVKAISLTCDGCGQQFETLDGMVCYADDEDGKSAAEEDMLTADRLQWRIGASVGRKFSKRFALNKTAQKVDYNPAQTTAEPSDSDEPTVTPGGGDPNGGND